MVAKIYYSHDSIFFDFESSIFSCFLYLVSKQLLRYQKKPVKMILHEILNNHILIHLGEIICSWVSAILAREIGQQPIQAKSN